MKVKIGDEIYDSEHQPIMVILTEKDKLNIANMAPTATKYCQYPYNISPEIIKLWMNGKYEPGVVYD